MSVRTTSYTSSLWADEVLFPNHTEQSALDAYLALARERNLSVVRGPVAFVQHKLFDDATVDIIVRAMVRKDGRGKERPA